MYLAYIIAICCPMQFLGPEEKGTKENGKVSDFSFLFQRYGSNSVGFLKYFGLNEGAKKKLRTATPYSIYKSSKLCVSEAVLNNDVGAGE